MSHTPGQIMVSPLSALGDVLNLVESLLTTKKKKGFIEIKGNLQYA